MPRGLLLRQRHDARERLHLLARFCIEVRHFDRVRWVWRDGHVHQLCGGQRLPGGHCAAGGMHLLLGLFLVDAGLPCLLWDFRDLRCVFVRAGVLLHKRELRDRVGGVHRHTWDVPGLRRRKRVRGGRGTGVLVHLHPRIRVERADERRLRREERDLRRVWRGQRMRGGRDAERAVLLRGWVCIKCDDF